MKHRRRPSAPLPVFSAESRTSSSAAHAVGLWNHRRTYTSGSDTSCWRRLPKWLRRRRSGMALSVAYDIARTHANSWTQRSFSRSPKCDRAWHSILYSVGACNSSRSGFPATPAHAASCPPLARERFMRGVARMPLGRTVNAARLWPYTKRSCIKRLAKTWKVNMSKQLCLFTSWNMACTGLTTTSGSQQQAHDRGISKWFALFPPFQVCGCSKILLCFLTCCP